MNRRVRRKVAAKGKGKVASPSYPEAAIDDEEEGSTGTLLRPSSSGSSSSPSPAIGGGDKRGEVDWTSLPDDTVLQLFSSLNYRDRASLSSTCRTWRALGSSDCLWEALDLRSHRCHAAVADSLSSRCSRLQSLRFRGAESADSVINFRARNLRDLSGDYCRKITDSTLSVIAARHDLLESLQLGPDFCERISSDAIKAVGICCPRLRVLRLSGLREIDSDAINALASNCPNLMDIGFIDCLKVDEAALGNVVSLRFLSLAGTTHLKWESASHLWCKLENLVGLDVSRTDIGASIVSRFFSVSLGSLRVMCALNCLNLDVEGGSNVRVPKGKLLLTGHNDVSKGISSLFDNNATEGKDVFSYWRSSMNKDKGLGEIMTWLEWILSHSLLRIAETNPQGLDQFWTTQGATLLLSLIQSSQEDVQEKAATGLATFVVIDDENASIDTKRAEAVMNGGGVHMLLGLASLWREGLQSEAAKALANLSVNASVAKAVAEEGGITILANLARSMNRLVAEEAAGALWNLSVGEEHKGAIAKAGGVKALVDLIFKWSTGAEGVLERAAGALANLAADDKCSIEVAVAGGVHALVTLARDCKFEGVQEQAARALANLAAHGDSNNNNAAVGEETGALEALVQLTQSPSEGVRQEAAGALWNLSFDDRNREAIAIAGGVAALVGLARACTNASAGLQERAAGALWGLSVSEANSIAIGREGGIQPLIALARSEVEDVHETAAGALWNLAFNPGNALRIVEEGGVLALVHLCSLSKSKMARFMAALALAYMFDGRMDEVAHVGTSAQGAPKHTNLDGSRRVALKHIEAFILSFSDPRAFSAAATSSAPAALAQVTEAARIQEAGHLRCSGAEIGRFITMLRNPSSTLKACAAFALLQFTMPGGRHAIHHVNLLRNTGAARALRSAAAAATAPLEPKIFARIVLRNLEHHQKETHQ